ncbi:RNA-binding protein [Fluviicola sp.]|jgi:RNA recognition motif-containing protein|uniref:RNA recognition motif domain-containing protein n=1 Tax=Fluviicola sp. TaxID=1917219 RepID=UPI002827E999|nr:RNA-binding protein [Fluviicola sp.]MDR0801016.1 RNA-binding protein [Fluviicola sp.]
MTNIFIANLDWEITSEDLQVTFSAFGTVHLAHVVFDAKTRKSKGFGYVEMESAEEAIKAIQALNGFEVNGRKLDVKIASPKANRPKPEDKPKKQFGNKTGGFGGQKKFNNGPRPGGGQGGGGSYRSNDRNSNFNREGGNRSGGGNHSGGGNRFGGGENRPGENSGERQMRPRRKFDN